MKRFGRAIDRWLRVLATGFSFLVFMGWGFSLGTVLFPLLGLFFARGRRRREVFMRHMSWVWRFFLRMMEITRAFGRIEIRGMEHFEQNRAALVVCNHPTLVDIVALGSRIQNFNCVVKLGLWRQPFFGSVVRSCDFIPNVGQIDFIKLCERGFSENRPLIIFPQGRRTPVDEPVSFARGAAQIAVRTGVPIVPVIITCDPPTLARGVPWYVVPPKPAHLVLRICRPLEIPAKIVNEPSMPLKVRRLNSFLENWFNRELNQTAVRSSD